jgi:PAS domain S-box-containing protein
MTLDENGIIKALNSVAAHFFGYESTEITGKNISVLIPHGARGTAANLKKLSVEAAATPQGAALTAQRKDGSPIIFNFLLKEITVSGRRLFTGLIREQSVRSQPKQAALKMAKQGAPSNDPESLELEETADHSKNGRSPASILPSNAPVEMAPSAQIPARLDQDAVAREKLEARCSDLSKIRIALEQDLARHQKAAQSSQERENELRVRQDELEAQLEKQGLERTNLQAKLENRLSELKRVEEAHTKLSFSRGELAGELAERQGNEKQLRKAQAALESQIQDRTRQIDQLASQLQKEVQHRQQAVEQAAQLSKTQAAAEEQFAVHKQAEETWRTTQQKIEAEAKKQASQLARMQEQLQKESGARQQAQAHAAELVKAQSALRQELTKYHQSQEYWQVTEQDLQSRYGKQTAELAQVRLQLQKEWEQRLEIQERASNLASTQAALAAQLEQRKQTDEALRKKSVELESRIQDRTRQIDQLASQLQKEVQLRQQAADVHKQAAETWRTTQQELESEVRKQASQLTRVQDQLHKESAECQQLAVLNHEFSKRESALKEELQQVTDARLEAQAEMEQERYTGLESAKASLRLAEDLYSSLRETTSRIAAFSCRLFESNLTEEQHAVVEEMQEMGKLFLPQDHLSEFSQCGVELADPGCSEFGLLKVVELSMEPFTTEAKKENIVIASLVHQDVPALVIGSEPRLRRVLAHFIDSSIQFTKGGSVIVSVTKESETQSQVVLRFSVKGGDHELSEESQRQLLKTCSQTRELGPANYTALELGLAAAKKLVEMMVGGFGIDITTTSTTLWCQLTFAKLTALFPSPSVTAEPGSLRVLVIEENEIKRGILQAQITASGMRNAGTNNGVEALSLLRQQIFAGDPFNVAIISTGLQDLNGLTLVKIFKGDPVLATTRLVILYHAAEAFNDAPYRKEQVFDFLTKPIRQSELLGLLNRIVSESTSNGSLAEPGLSRIQS